MTNDSNVDTSVQDRALCPVKKTHRRLAEAHLLWHQALTRYHDPEAFRANLNALIEALRNVTWVLQNEKHQFADFEKWYGPWQARLKSDSAAKWMHKARNAVVHQGELESRSKADVRLVTWRNEILTSVAVPVGAPTSEILASPKVVELVDKYRAAGGGMNDAAIAVERRWTTEDLGGLEILDVLAQAYGLLSDLVLDAHVHHGRLACMPEQHDHSDFRTTHHRTGILECMSASQEKRTEAFKLDTGEQLEPIETIRRIDPNRSRSEEETILHFAEWEKLNPLQVAEKTLYHAKRALARDKYHHRIAFIRDSAGKWHMKVLLAADRTEKHLLMQSLAQFVESKGCDALVEIGEMWSAPVESMVGLEISRIQEAKGRGEILYLLVATREGFVRNYWTPFSRGPFGGIKLKETIQKDGEFPPYLFPIVDVWRRQGSFQSSHGQKLPRVWEPDPLDTCFCGGPKRFGECCKPMLISVRSNPVRKQIEEAKNASNFAEAERIARAGLAQYVIWVKQHTAITMNVAVDLYKQLVDIDVLALEHHVNLLEGCLDTNGKSDLFAGQIRNLATTIGVPRLSIRLVALVSRSLLRSGRIEEAILELDTLGDPFALDDTLALMMLADLSDQTPEKAERLLLRAVTAASCEEEAWSAKFSLVQRYRQVEKNDLALSILNSVVEESTSRRETEAQVEALFFRWEITKADSDLESFKHILVNQSEVNRQQYIALLLDYGKHVEAVELLESDPDKEQPFTKLLLADAWLRSGNATSARRVFMTIQMREIPPHHHNSYAVVAGHLALSCNDDETRLLAVSSLEQVLSAGGGTKRAKQLLLELQNKT